MTNDKKNAKFRYIEKIKHKMYTVNLQIIMHFAKNLQQFVCPLWNSLAKKYSLLFYKLLPDYVMHYIHYIFRCSTFNKRIFYLFPLYNCPFDFSRIFVSSTIAYSATTKDERVHSRRCTRVIHCDFYQMAKADYPYTKFTSVTWMGFRKNQSYHRFLQRLWKI